MSVTRCSNFLMKKVFVSTRSKLSQLSRSLSPSSFLFPYPFPPCVPLKPPVPLQTSPFIFLLLSQLPPLDKRALKIPSNSSQNSVLALFIATPSLRFICRHDVVYLASFHQSHFADPIIWSLHFNNFSPSLPHLG